MPFANTVSVQKRTNLQTIEKCTNFAFNMNVSLCIGTCFGIFHLIFDPEGHRVEIWQSSNHS